MTPLFSAFTELCSQELPCNWCVFSFSRTGVFLSFSRTFEEGGGGGGGE